VPKNFITDCTEYFLGLLVAKANSSVDSRSTQLTEETGPTVSVRLSAVRHPLSGKLGYH